MSGFGKNSGPSKPPGSSPFGQFPRPSSPSPISPRSSIDYSDLDAPDGMYSPPLAFGHSSSARGSSRSFSGTPNYSDIPSSNKSYLIPPQARSPSQAFQNNRYVGGQHPHTEVQHRPLSPPVWGIQSKSSNNYNARPAQEDVRPVSTGRGTYQSERIFQTSRVDVAPPKRARSPILSSTSGASPENIIFPSDGHQRSPIDYRDLDAPEAMPSRPSASKSGFSSGDSRPFTVTQKSSPSSSTWYQSQSSINNTAPPVKADMSSNLASGDALQRGRTLESNLGDALQRGRTLESNLGDVPLTKRTRAPTPPFTGAFPQNPFSASDAHKRALDSQSHRSISGHTISTEDAEEKKPMDFQAVKKTKLPLASLSTRDFQENLDSSQEIERELNAKAKRLARFKDELSQPEPSHSSIRHHNAPPKRQHQSTSEKQRFSEDFTMDVREDFAGGNVPIDSEGVASSSSIIGICPDMCPESERAERGRKGDLDRYERLDGDRNLTSEFLAVKKYTRTAEREAFLIRPMPILQKTMEYLLNLLDQPYGDQFLGLYNFLWDRMRAIRMDLRMQHIFNLEAINMLEQMIRLHIIAMHELCEYTKGEGFSEGFDAHLNIEQMNKTSVELFQFYDDHRKKGIPVPSEKEFRGYYALLKLDKHPGYKVEPAELSLDLAKMTPEMRQSPEVFFARDVARACRTGNYIAFFRLARKASYLQACLMHAHFSKLRTQALASLHSGLQMNQGIPVDHVAKWLGMEEEDIENLLEYYGFKVKDFEEPYMVKENTFFNVDNDFPVKCSKLVERKRSRMIVSDVSSPSVGEIYANEKVNDLWKDPQSKPPHVQVISPLTTTRPSDEEMHDSDTILSPKANVQKLIHKTSGELMTPNEKLTRPEIQMAPASPVVLDFSKSSSEHPESRIESAQKPKFDPVFRNSFGRMINQSLEATSPKFDSVFRTSSGRMINQSLEATSPKFDPVFRNSFGRMINQSLEATSSAAIEMAEEERSPVLDLDSAAGSPLPQHIFAEYFEDEEPTGVEEEDKVDEATITHYDREIAEAKLKLILRIWKRRTTKKRELRECKMLASNAALSLLSLGPPIWKYEVQSGNNAMFDIDYAMSERREMQEKLWSVLNPSEIVATTLAEKNPDAKCLCWKIVLCSQEELPSGDDIGQQNEVVKYAADSWLHSKLSPANTDVDQDLLISSPGLAIWKSWIPDQTGDDAICCLSVIKSSKFEDPNKEIAGASAVLFLLSENIPIELQKNRLHNLIMLLPSGSRLPLLILSGSGENDLDSSTIAKDLELHGIDRSRVITFSIIFLKDQMVKNFDGFFSSERLRDGLEWLANESPPQIVIRQTKTRELVRSHLCSSLDVLDEMNYKKVGPDYCVSAFNEVLDRSIKEVMNAANANPTGWPCPEIALLEESSNEYTATCWYLPDISWSSTARTEPVISALNDSKLPPFNDDLSWLSRGLNTGDDIENQKLNLRNCLISYLTKTTQMMGVALAEKEASILLQKCTRLELHNAAFYIIPNWLTIFRRIFSWRLMNITSSEEVSSTYVLVKNDFSSPESEVMNQEPPRSSTFLPPYIAHLSLDEMVAVSYNPQELGSIYMDHEMSQPLLPVASDNVDVPTSNGSFMLMENEEGKSDPNGILTLYNDSASEVNEGVPTNYTTRAGGEADELSKMLEKCEILQNLIDKKLSIFF